MFDSNHIIVNKSLDKRHSTFKHTMFQKERNLKICSSLSFSRCKFEQITPCAENCSSIIVVFVKTDQLSQFYFVLSGYTI